ncbi:formate dehydrogenase accessory sulfurtransferase FdhD [Ruania halotolerans]|uniref:formate dehydrogenase accessory sulfurtransferase FdhD n=1 Tax=Ruania halotolerans TaxID=2897773 RepID=UPI001E4BADC9|nr:formate dehydrogenase accessory sulfurtransferase FdhD [Ruania halotolerans]UFU07338.1 formate dehydrogenase accessory sulfurtransferase FdhD [Ruania halotolerans]
MARVSTRRRTLMIDGEGRRRERMELLAGEEPLEVRVNGRSLAVTMRTPGHDFDLAAGFLVAETVVHAREQIAQISYGPGVDASGMATYNIVDVTLAPGVPPPAASAERAVYTSSSCGICGVSSIEEVTKEPAFPRRSADGVPSAGEQLVPEVLLALPGALRERQSQFDKTGGTHAAGLFTTGGELLCLREDVGRHNAVDKVVGWALRDGRLPLRPAVLQVSGRASFELVQKAHLAGIETLAAVSAPSALAVELADDAGMTLIGFSRGDRLTVYAGAGRIAGAAAPG